MAILQVDIVLQTEFALSNHKVFPHLGGSPGAPVLRREIYLEKVFLG
jgi:hypothetical protein